jgi:hypothetical protein
MLRLTRRLNHEPARLDGLDANSFKEKVCGLISEMKDLDLDPPTQGDCEMGSAEEKALKEQIAGTVQRLMDTNHALVASIKAQQEILGEKIACLKKSRAVLKTYRPNLQKGPSLIDSEA